MCEQMINFHKVVAGVFHSSHRRFFFVVVNAVAIVVASFALGAEQESRNHKMKIWLQHDAIILQHVQYINKFINGRIFYSKEICIKCL